MEERICGCCFSPGLLCSAPTPAGIFGAIFSTTETGSPARRYLMPILQASTLVSHLPSDLWFSLATSLSANAFLCSAVSRLDFPVFATTCGKRNDHSGKVRLPTCLRDLQGLNSSQTPKLEQPSAACVWSSLKQTKLLWLYLATRNMFSMTLAWNNGSSRTTVALFAKRQLREKLCNSKPVDLLNIKLNYARSITHRPPHQGLCLPASLHLNVSSIIIAHSWHAVHEWTQKHTVRARFFIVCYSSLNLIWNRRRHVSLASRHINRYLQSHRARWLNLKARSSGIAKVSKDS